MPTQSAETVTATAYLTVSAKRRKYDGSIQSAKIVNSTLGKPHTLNADQIVIKVSVQLPKDAFEPLEPEATIIVPESFIQHPAIVDVIPSNDA